MSDSWQNATAEKPCEVCGKHGWCSRSDDGSRINCRHSSHFDKYGDGKPHTAADGHQFWTFVVAPDSFQKFDYTPTLQLSSTKASDDILHAVYSTVLAKLDFGNSDLIANLKGRGLSPAQILLFQQNGYRWLPELKKRNGIVKAALRAHGEAAVASTPGFTIAQNRKTGSLFWTLSGDEGIAIPVRDCQGRVVAIKVRPKVQKPGKKYLYLTSHSASRKIYGASPGNPVHIPVSKLTRDLIRITEGEIKSDISTVLSGVFTIGMSGLAWKTTLPILAQFNPKRILIALDTDYQNRSVASAIRKLVEHCELLGFNFAVETWDPRYKGIDDALAAGVSIRQIEDPEEIRSLLSSPASLPTSIPPEQSESNSQAPTSAGQKPARPTVVLPGKGVEISETAAELGQLLGASGKWFRRGMAVLTLSADDEGKPVLRPSRPATLPSSFEAVSELRVLREGEDGPIAVPTVCSEQTAKLIAHADSFLSFLPPIRILAQSPVLVESDGELVEVIGYHRESGVLAFGSQTENVPLPEAVPLLKSLIRDFKFSTPSDESRAIAALITPALVQGGLLRGRSPIDLGEADQSQTGKGFRNRITAAVYRQPVRTVAQRSGGVGSLEEDMSTKLIAGANFICLDNIRGKIDSPAIESMLTEDLYSARVPHSAAVEIDPRRVIVMMTSNAAQVTDDMANRASCVRMLKQDQRYRFQIFPEGDILEHIHANQPRYLGAVFAVIREWHRQGKPRSTEVRHDFRPWAQTLDWIIQNVMGCPPLLEGHQAAQQRISNPTLSWLRDVALRICQSHQNGQWIRTNEILDVLIDAGDVEIPGVKEESDLDCETVRTNALRQIGQKLGRCFKGQAFIDVDNVQIDRNETTDDQHRKRYDYKFSMIPVSPRITPNVTPNKNTDNPASPASLSSTPVENTKHDTYTYLESNATDAGYRGKLGVNGFNTGKKEANDIEIFNCPDCGRPSNALPGMACDDCRF